mmetsp:Transcript_6434/g.22925  ORF Transcript_6434/g.22925 Transcript_6434/m.22925 type:complete len:256 (-) Transcript_6434:1214-1981(-)
MMLHCGRLAAGGIWSVLLGRLWLLFPETRLDRRRLGCRRHHRRRPLQVEVLRQAQVRLEAAVLVQPRDVAALVAVGAVQGRPGVVGNVDFKVVVLHLVQRQVLFHLEILAVEERHGRPEPLPLGFAARAAPPVGFGEHELLVRHVFRDDKVLRPVPAALPQSLARQRVVRAPGERPKNSLLVHERRVRRACEDEDVELAGVGVGVEQLEAEAAARLRVPVHQTPVLKRPALFRPRLGVRGVARGALVEALLLDFP